MPPAETRIIGDVAIAVHDRGAAIALIEGWVNAGERRAVSFANAHSVNLAARDPALRAALSDMIVLNDGIGHESCWMLPARCRKPSRWSQGGGIGSRRPPRR